MALIAAEGKGRGVVMLLGLGVLVIYETKATCLDRSVGSEMVWMAQSPGTCFLFVTELWSCIFLAFQLWRRAGIKSRLWLDFTVI